MVEKSRNSCALSMQVVCLIICNRAISFESKTSNNFFYGGFSLRGKLKSFLSSHFPILSPFSILQFFYPSNQISVVYLGILFLLNKFFKRFYIFSPNTVSFNICFYCYMDCGDMYVWFTIENSRLFLMILYVL